MMGRRSVLIAMLALTSAAQGMHLDRLGLGQVLISPYYTVNGGHQTLVSIANRSDAGKALKLRFLEGMNGRETFAVNIYLAPHDQWTAALFSAANNGPANLVTADDSCTVPAIKRSTVLPQLPDGRRIAPFGNAQYVGANDDAGPDDLARTREGYFEIIEMGEVINVAQLSLSDITPRGDGVPANCPRVEAAWATGGHWATNPETDMAAPAGGLSASISLVDVMGGSMYTFQAAAIDGFSSIIQHTAPGSPLPNLASGITHLDQGMVEAEVRVDGHLIVARYPRARAIDAVSALFMAETLTNEFTNNPASGSRSAWVMTFPTRKFYVDDALVQTEAIAPFTKLFSVGALSQDHPIPPPIPGSGEICPHALAAARGEAMDIELFDREAGPSRSVCDYNGQNLLLNKAQVPSFYWSSNLLAFDAGGMFDSISELFPSRLSQRVLARDYGVDAGWLRLRLQPESDPQATPAHALRVDESGHRFTGLPVIGFSAANFTNGQLQPGVLSNYASVRTHSLTRREVPVAVLVPSDIQERIQ